MAQSTVAAVLLSSDGLSPATATAGPTGASVDTPITTAPAKLRILQVCGATDIVNDHWFFEDHILFRLALSTLPSIENVIYMHCIDLAKAQTDRWIGKFGSLRAERVLTEHDVGGTNTMQRKPKKLKKFFLELLTDFVLATDQDDRLIVLISGHGHDTLGYEGGVSIGTSIIPSAKLLLPDNVLKIIKLTKGRTTLIVNSCHSGHWIANLEARDVADGGLKNLTLITRSNQESEIESHSVSGSMRYRGGYFVNCLIGRIFGEFGIRLPRPLVLSPSTTNMPPVTPPSYMKVFPDHNIGRFRFNRTTFSTVEEVIADAGQDLSILRGSAPTPMMSGPQGTSASHGFNLGEEYEMAIMEVTPANPGVFPGTGQTGSGVDPQFASILALVGQYRLLPLSSPTASRNVPVEVRINLARAGKASSVQLESVRRELEERIKAIHAARNLALELHLPFPTIHSFPRTDFRKNWPICEFLVLRIAGRTWNDARDLLLAAIEARISGDPAMNIEDLQTRLKWAILKMRVRRVVGNA